MAEAEDARSEASFQSADDDEDDFDLPQDIAGGADDSAPQGGGALPPGLDDGGDEAGIERWNLRNDGNKEQLEPIWARLSGEREHVKISKMFSYVLRHAAHKLDVCIRKDGFVRLREIMKLRNFKPYTLEELMAVVYFDEKERYTMVREFDGELLIRANQGHTMKVVESDLLLELVEAEDEISECVHGTYLVHWPFIKRQGLSKVARNHIHLANGLPEDGKIRGMRSTAELFVYVDVRHAIEDGVVFYRSKNDVILTQGFDGWLPPKYFLKAVRIDYNTCDIEELEFDGKVETPTWAAELAPSGPGDQGTYLIKNLEALISNCRKRLSEINELKAMQENGQELTDDEADRVSKHAQAYTELLSLEQRFRQHKGHRRETAQEKEQRVREEAEVSTVVQRKDRAVTPPWERGKTNLKSVGTSAKQTEKEKAEWAALGRRREQNQAPPEKPAKSAGKEDPWAVLGGKRQSAPSTPGNADGEERRPYAFGASLGREDSGRFGAKKSETGPQLSRGNSGPQPSPSGGERPRFFNSKLNAMKSEGSSWRDRMSSGAGDGDNSQSSNWRDRPSVSSSAGGAEEPSWRDKMSLLRAEVEAQEKKPPQTPGGSQVAAMCPAPVTPQAGAMQQSPMNMTSPMWRGGGQPGMHMQQGAMPMQQGGGMQMQQGGMQMQQGMQQAGMQQVYGYNQGGCQQAYFVQAQQNPDGSMGVAHGGWMQPAQGQYMGNSQVMHQQQNGTPMQQGCGGYGYCGGCGGDGSMDQQQQGGYGGGQMGYGGGCYQDDRGGECGCCGGCGGCGGCGCGGSCGGCGGGCGGCGGGPGCGHNDGRGGCFQDSRGSGFRDRGDGCGYDGMGQGCYGGDSWQGGSHRDGDGYNYYDEDSYDDGGKGRKGKSSDSGKGGGKSKKGKDGKGAGGKAFEKGRGKDRGGDDGQDWAALGRMRAAA